MYQFIKIISIYVIESHNLPRFQSMDVPKFRTEYCKYSPHPWAGNDVGKSPFSSVVAIRPIWNPR